MKIVQFFFSYSSARIDKTSKSSNSAVLGSAVIKVSILSITCLYCSGVLIVLVVNVSIIIF